MESSFETPDDAFKCFRSQQMNLLCDPSVSCAQEDNDIIDSTELKFSDDEVWLCECPSKSDTNLHKWLYESEKEEVDPKLAHRNKNIDTRTFTRPKKRFTRPSIEKYNEELYSTDVKEIADNGLLMNGSYQDVLPTKPLHFDLGQTSSVYFDNILANAPMTDSFQNMSPPSLVNSMCSSTFANLMESSFIKNDPVLREIRDTDYTGSVLQQEVEPVFQSISESCSSLNSDVPENFLKKVSFNEEQETLVLMDGSGEKNSDLPSNQTMIFTDKVEEPIPSLNSTFQATTKPIPLLNSTFNRRKTNKENLNSTITLEKDVNISSEDKTMENVKRLLDRRASPSLDLNRLSYLVDRNDQLNSTFPNEKRNSCGSTDSGENLDFMSLSSGSSKSSKIRSIEGINTAIDMKDQKRRLSTLQHIVSTPMRHNKTINLWSSNEISPISDRNSDPEISCSEQTHTIFQNTIRKQKSVGQINQKTAVYPKTQKINREQNTIKSNPNLKIADSRSLQKPTNLRSMGQALKGSYTSLKPANTNLPVAPPPLDTTTIVSKNTQNAQGKVQPSSQNVQFAKPQVPRSGLPRPVTGIPRPVSRIPGPKTIRPPKSAG